MQDAAHMTPPTDDGTPAANPEMEKGDVKQSPVIASLNEEIGPPANDLSGPQRIPPRRPVRASKEDHAHFERQVAKGP